MRRLSRKEVADLGIYDFLGYIGAFNTPYIGGLTGNRKLIEALGIEKNEDLRVLEIGCATGFTSCLIAREFGCQVTGIDISEILIEKSQEKAQKQNIGNADFKVADALQLPFEDDSFDIVFGIAVTALVPDREQALSEYIRVVRPGGMIGALDLFLPSDASEEVSDMFNRVMKDLIGGTVQIRTIDDWTRFYTSHDLDGVTVRETYEDVLVNPRNRRSATWATLKMLYHMVINGAVRKKMFKLMRLRREAVSQIDAQFENLGYLIFTGRKPVLTE